MKSRTGILAFFVLAITFTTQQVLAKKGNLLVSSTSTQRQRGVILTVNKLEPYSRKRITRRKIYKKYQPLEIVIDNKSSNTYLLSKKNLDLEIEDPKVISRSLKKKRQIGLALGILFAIPTVFFATASAAMFVAGYTTVGTGWKTGLAIGLSYVFSAMFFVASAACTIPSGTALGRRKLQSKYDNPSCDL